MYFIHLGEVPVGDSEALSTWLHDLVVQVNVGIRETNTLEPEKQLPAKPENGRVYYFPDRIDGHSIITSGGFYGYHKTATSDWVKLG